MIEPQMDADERRLNLICQTVIGCAFSVANTLGNGFLEKVYENALDVVVGVYVADLLVEESVLVELKAVKALDDIHMAQCLNYLKATGFRVCLLLNFGEPKVKVKRIVHAF